MQTPARALLIIACNKKARRRFTSGLFARASIKGPADAAIVLPAEAVLVKEGKTFTVYLERPSGLFEAREVRIGPSVDGKVQIAAKNDSSLPHNLHIIDSDSVDVGLSLSMNKKGDVKTGSVALAPGTYQVICTIAGHGNMKSTLTVS